MKNDTAYFLLGSNIGDRVENLRKAVLEIKDCIGPVVRMSELYITEPWGNQDQGPFINQAIEVATSLGPSKALDQALKIQYAAQDFMKDSKFGPRILDIDLLLYGDAVIKTRDLTLPHPRMHKRNFVLIPLAEIAGDVIHPIFSIPIRELLEACSDTGEVRVYERNDH